MNKFVNKILAESKSKNLKETKEDDPFFRPKNIEKRKEEERRKRKEILSKIQIGLQNIKVAYENEDWNLEPEKLFLKIFCKVRLNEKYDKKWNGYFLEDENDNNICFFSLKSDVFWVSYNRVWSIFQNEFNWRYDEVQYFMKDMLNEHFKLYEFTPSASISSAGHGLNEHFKLYE